MAAASSVLEDTSVLSRFDRTLYKLEGWLALISGLAAFSLMVLAVVSVTGRNFFNAPLPGYVDWIEQAMPVIALTGVAYVQRLGGHIRMDLFVSFASGRALWVIEFLTVLLMLGVTILLLWGSWSHFGRSFDWAAPMFSRDSSMDIAIPLWPAKLIVPVAFAVLAVRFLLQLWAYGRAIVQNAERPVAVPLIEDAAAQAAREAATVSDAVVEGATAGRERSS